MNKRCETCKRDQMCSIGWCCTRSRTHRDHLTEDQKNMRYPDIVGPDRVGLQHPADFWTEGTEIRHLLFRIDELEKKLEGV